MVGARVHNDKQTRLDEALLDLVREGARGVAARKSRRAGVVRELQCSTLSKGTGRDNNNLSRILNSYDDTGSQLDLLPGAGQVQQVDTVGATRVDIAIHLRDDVAGTNVDLASEHSLHIVFGELQGGNRGAHLVNGTAKLP